MPQLPSSAKESENDPMHAKETFVLSTVQDIVNIIAYHNVVGVMICVPCRTALQSLGALRSHIQSRHISEVGIGKDFVTAICTKYSITLGQSVLNKAQSKAALPRCLDGKTLSAAQRLYWDAPISLKRKTTALPEIEQLEVYRGFQCPEVDCFYCCTSSETLRVHRIRDHKNEKVGTVSPEASGTGAAVYVQRLGSGNNCPFFPVVVKDMSRVRDSRLMNMRREKAPAGVNKSILQDGNVQDLQESTDSTKLNLIEEVHTSKGTVLRTETIPAVPQSGAVCVPDIKDIWLSIAHIHPSSFVRTCPASQNLEHRIGEVDLDPNLTLQSKEGSLFVRQCNFKEMLSFLNFKDLQAVPFELTVLPSRFSRGNLAVLPQPGTGATEYDAGKVQNLLKIVFDHIGCDEQQV